MVDVAAKAAHEDVEPAETIKSVIQRINDAVKKELDKGSPDKVRLDNYSKLYSSLAAIAATYRTSTTSFSLTRPEWTIIGTWFVGLIVTALLVVAFGLKGADVATVIASWTAVLLGLLGVSALSSAKK